MNKIAVVVNTVSSCSDIWPMFFNQFEKFFPRQKIYVFTDSAKGLPDNCTPIIYNPSDSYRTQYLNCIKQVGEKYCITLNEDYVLYSKVNVEELLYCIEFLDLFSDFSFVRLTKGTEYHEPIFKYKLYLMSNNNMWFFSQVAGIWRTRDLEKIHEHAPESGMAFKVQGPQLEIVANDVCKNLHLQGVFYYNGEPKRGSAHYDSSIFPYIASAVIKGKWNLTEYLSELTPLFEQYHIDPSIRGAV